MLWECLCDLTYSAFRKARWLSLSLCPLSLVKHSCEEKSITTTPRWTKAYYHCVPSKKRALGGTNRPFKSSPWNCDSTHTSAWYGQSLRKYNLNYYKNPCSIPSATCVINGSMLLLEKKPSTRRKYNLKKENLSSMCYHLACLTVLGETLIIINYKCTSYISNMSDFWNYLKLYRMHEFLPSFNFFTHRSLLCGLGAKI